VLNPIDPVHRAFRAGVRAGNNASKQLADLPAQTPYLQQLQYFWLKVGTDMNTAIADPRQEQVLVAFLEGAATSKPQIHLILTLDTVPGSADTVPALDADTEPDSDTGRRIALAAALANIAQQIRGGIDNGPVRSGEGGPIGHLTINVWT
jgi:hypothetical protein